MGSSSVWFSPACAGRFAMGSHGGFVVRPPAVARTLSCNARDIPRSLAVSGIEKQRRVDHHAIEADRPVQVRASHATGRPDSAQYVTRGQLVSRLDIDGAEMAIHGQQAAAMVEPDRLAIEEVVAAVDHAAGCRGEYGRAHGCSDVHAGVRVARLAVEHPAQPE